MTNKNVEFKQWLYCHHKTFFQKVFEQPISVTSETEWKILRDSLPDTMVWCEEYKTIEAFTENHDDQIRTAMETGHWNGTHYEPDHAFEMYMDLYVKLPFWDCMCYIASEDILIQLEDRGFG